MTRHYPLNALRAFEIAARKLSFVEAAEELCVTPAAVSHQVKNLEDFLGLQLFRRQPRGLLLTDAGQQLGSELRQVFADLDKAMERVAGTAATGPFTISVAPMFATKWLLPRLQEFSATHPQLDLRISSSLNLVNLKQEGFDAAVRLGKGSYSGLTAMKLFEDSVTPMCSPNLLEGKASLVFPEDLGRLRLLHDDSMSIDPEAPHWGSWLQRAGVTTLDSSRGPRFSQPDYAIQAAIDGAGVVLGWERLAADDIAAGRLVAPFKLSLPLGSSFFLVYPEAHDKRPKIAAFRNWLQHLLDT